MISVSYPVILTDLKVSKMYLIIIVMARVTI